MPLVPGCRCGPKSEGSIGNAAATPSRRLEAAEKYWPNMISPTRGCCRREAVFCLLFATAFLSNGSLPAPMSRTRHILSSFFLCWIYPNLLDRLCTGLAHEGLEPDHHEHTHSCGHNIPENKEFQEHMHEEYKVTRELTKQMRANMQISDPSTTGPARRAYSTGAAVRILADYDQLGSGTTADTIRNTIMPKAIAVMARQMSMKSPLSGNLYLPVNCVAGFTSGDSLYCTQVDSSSSDPGICSFSDLGVSHSWKYFGSYQICTGPSPDACTDHAGDPLPPSPRQILGRVSDLTSPVSRMAPCLCTLRT